MSDNQTTLTLREKEKLAREGKYTLTREEKQRLLRLRRIKADRLAAPGLERLIMYQEPDDEDS